MTKPEKTPGESGGSTDWSSTITQRIYERIREMILQSEFAPGQKLSTGTLSTMFGVSSTPIREALRLLEQASLVEITPHRGAVVRPIFSVKQVEDIYDVRLALEQLAIRLVMPRIQDADWSSLDEAAGQYTKAWEADDWDLVLKSDREFHGIIVRSANNDVLTQIASRLENQIQMVRSMDRGTPRRVQSERDHHLIVEALKRHDGEGALSVLSSHITNGKQHVSAVVSKLR